MVRASSSSSKSKKDEDKNTERSRLKTLAIRKQILSDTPAKGFTPLCPTKHAIKHHGKDILRKSSQRKNRFLFSFPGLLGSIGGGKIGELKNLGTQNPILYLDFPQGQMKLFGTIVYPENRYLTLQFSKGGKNVMCEDCFDNVIVFSDAWWIGRKDENPDEARLDFPKELSEVQGQHLVQEQHFKGGAGAEFVNKQAVPKTELTDLEAQSPETKSEDDYSDIENTLKDKMEVTPVRHSDRTAGRTFKFAEVSSEDDTAKSDADISDGEEKKAVIDVDSEDAAKENCSTKQVESSAQPVTKSKKSKSAVSVSKSKEVSSDKHGSLVQATISTLFKKVEEKSTPNNTRKSSASKASSQKLQHRGLKRNIDQAEVSNKKGKVIKEKITGTRNRAKKKEYEVEDEDIEEFSSSSKDTSGSDEDWAA